MLHFSSPFCWQLIHALELLPKVRLLAWYLPLPVPRWYWTRKQARLAKAMRTSSTYDEWRGGQTYDSAYGFILVLSLPGTPQPEHILSFLTSLFICLFLRFLFGARTGGGNGRAARAHEVEGVARGPTLPLPSRKNRHAAPPTRQAST